MNKKFQDCRYKLNFHFQNILKACDNKFEEGCGSYLFDGKNYSYFDEYKGKQILLFEKVQNKKNILEIGTYMGHSLLIMLLSNPNLKITCIDINDEFSFPATEYLKKNFPKAKINFIHNDSLNVIDKLEKGFDLIHIDGAHKNKIITKEFNYCKNLGLHDDLEFIFDDSYNCKNLILNILASYKVKEYKSVGRDYHTCDYLKIRYDSSILQNIIFSYLNLKDYFFHKLKKIMKGYKI